MVVDEVVDQHQADFYEAYRSGKYGRMIELADRVRSRAESPDTVLVTVGRVRAEVMSQLTGLRVVEPRNGGGGGRGIETGGRRGGVAGGADRGRR